MQTKSYSDAEADDADGIHTKNNMSPTPSEGGHNQHLYLCLKSMTCIIQQNNYQLEQSLVAEWLRSLISPLLLTNHLTAVYSVGLRVHVGQAKYCLQRRLAIQPFVQNSSFIDMAFLVFDTNCWGYLQAC